MSITPAHGTEMIITTAEAAGCHPAHAEGAAPAGHDWGIMLHHVGAISHLQLAGSPRDGSIWDHRQASETFPPPWVVRLQGG
jgi:hypothetical protein